MQKLIPTDATARYDEKGDWIPDTAVRRRWCYTLNNPTDDERDGLRAQATSTHRCCLEVGASGTPHLQGALVLKTASRLTALHTRFPRAHWTPWRSEAALDYCVKGKMLWDHSPEQRKHQRLAAKQSIQDEVISQIRAGSTMRAIAEDHPAFVMYHAQGIQSLRRTIAPRAPLERPLQVIWIYGNPGVGKSHMAMHYAPEDDFHILEQPGPDGKLWFDGYDNQLTLVIEELSKPWINFNFLLRLTDKWRVSLDIKGTRGQAFWTTVIITSNYPPEVVYPVERVGALLRRINEIIAISGPSPN